MRLFHFSKQSSLGIVISYVVAFSLISSMTKKVFPFNDDFDPEKAHKFQIAIVAFSLISSMTKKKKKKKILSSSMTKKIPFNDDFEKAHKSQIY